MNDLALIIAEKEMLEASRDRRSVFSSLVYTLMGPAIAGLIAFTRPASANASDEGTLLALTSVFLLLSGFTGGMNIAMDTLAGERERRSLLPLLMNPLSRMQVVAGKWISVSLFAALAILLNLSAFAFVIHHALPGYFSTHSIVTLLFYIMMAMVPQALFAAAGELAVSTV